MTSNPDAEKKHSEWLIMVFVAGDNNLSANSIALLQDLEAANRNENVRVLAAFDSATPIPKGARYIEIGRRFESVNGFTNLINWPLHNDLITPGHIVVSPDFCAPPGKTASATTEPTAEQALARFLDFARAHYVADRYMLILFGHGNLVAGNTFLADTSPPSFLKLDVFADILRTSFGQKIDILGFANCVMNGIETAVQLHQQVDFTIGSQGLMLALGWPFRRIIETVGENHDLDTKALARQILRVCARNLLDFTLMERSSEQAICDVTKFGSQDTIVSAVRELSGHLQTGLQLNPDDSGDVRFPVVRDVVRLARLEAQAYFSETFVDLYDFCELLVLKRNDVLGSLIDLGITLSIDTTPQDNEDSRASLKRFLLGWPDLKALDDIATAAWHVLEAFRSEGIVPDAYYVCPQLQYSHGLSIFFPWTLPEGPITFEPVPGSSSRPTDFRFNTPFDVYQQYQFAGPGFGDWANFLEAFFRATLRNVRRFEAKYTPADDLFFRALAETNREGRVTAVDLQKSSSDTGEGDESAPQIKNYPRRFCVSPADCTRRLPIFGLPGSPPPAEEDVVAQKGKVSYLGWNIRGLVAEVIAVTDAPEETHE